MSWIHAGCRDARCKGPNGCYNRGPQGQWCFFDYHHKLAEVLGLSWDGQDMDHLITMVRDRLEQEASKDDYSRAIEKAQLAVTKPSPLGHSTQELDPDEFPRSAISPLNPNREE